MRLSVLNSEPEQARFLSTSSIRSSFFPHQVYLLNLVFEIFRCPEAYYFNVYPFVVFLKGKVWNKGILTFFQYRWLSLDRPTIEAEQRELLFNGTVKGLQIGIRLNTENLPGIIQSEIINPFTLHCFFQDACLQTPFVALHDSW